MIISGLAQTSSHAPPTHLLNKTHLSLTVNLSCTYDQDYLTRDLELFSTAALNGALNTTSTGCTRLVQPEQI